MAYTYLERGSRHCRCQFPYGHLGDIVTCDNCNSIHVYTEVFDVDYQADPRWSGKWVPIEKVEVVRDYNNRAKEAIKSPVKKGFAIAIVPMLLLLAVCTILEFLIYGTVYDQALSGIPSVLALTATVVSPMTAMMVSEGRIEKIRKDRNKLVSILKD